MLYFLVVSTSGNGDGMMLKGPARAAFSCAVVGPVCSPYIIQPLKRLPVLDCIDSDADGLMAKLDADCSKWYYVKIIMASRVCIEVCADSLQSACDAVQAGADRIELCGNLGLGGGTTPSIGLVKSVRRALPDTPIMVMVRPRTGDFLYATDEFDVMVEDVRSFKTCGIRGIVIGLLTAEGRVDVKRTRLLVEEVAPLEVCFHRAFDMTRDANEALHDISNIRGITRILTSGQGKFAVTSLWTLESLILAAHKLAEDGDNGSLTILPGSGINPSTVVEVLSALLPVGLREIHLSGGRWEEGGMLYRREGMGMGVGIRGEWGIWRVDGKTISKVRDIADGAMKVTLG